MNAGDTHDPPLRSFAAHTVRKISMVSPDPKSLEHREIHCKPLAQIKYYVPRNHPEIRGRLSLTQPVRRGTL